MRTLIMIPQNPQLAALQKPLTAAEDLSMSKLLGNNFSLSGRRFIWRIANLCICNQVK